MFSGGTAGAHGSLQRPPLLPGPEEGHQAFMPSTAVPSFLSRLRETCNHQGLETGEPKQPAKM